MTAIGIDSHKATLAACAIDELGAPVDERTFSNDPAGHRDLAAWVRRVAPGGVVGVEGSASYGAAAARFLLSDGLMVREVPPQLSRRERIRTRRAGKSDPGDALAIARVTAREVDLPPVRVVDRTSEIKLLMEAREDVVAETTRVRNRLHADLVVLIPGLSGHGKAPRRRAVPAGGQAASSRPRRDPGRARARPPGSPARARSTGAHPPGSDRPAGGSPSASGLARGGRPHCCQAHRRDGRRPSLPLG